MFDSDGFLGSAIWFLAGLFAVPWVVGFGLGFIFPLVGLTGAILIYGILVVQAIIAAVGWSWHAAFGIGIAIATAVTLAEMFLGFNIPFL